MTFVLLRTWRPFFGRGDVGTSTVTIAVLCPGLTRRPRTRHLSQCSKKLYVFTRTLKQITGDCLTLLTLVIC